MKTAFFSSLILSLSISAQCQQPEIYSSSGTAINGYDVVAYFKEGQPVEGSKDFSYEWKGAQWLFSSQGNLATFKSDPEKYAPQFGGYCAFGVAEDHTAPTKPDAWTIVDGKLYFNYNTDVRKMWREKQAEYIQQGNQNWPGVLDK
ncbi:MAG TPA: YHS domain-containing (seleno)protein [Cyclobacteriaceae bacterium]|nr:YHS domain-containing (seleno)protein [Cyclobacteriaceae bacterium]